MQRTYKQPVSMSRPRILSVILVFTILMPLSVQAKMEIKGEWLYVDGERFLVRGIGYSPFRTVRDYKSVPNWLIEDDFQRIKAAGFNTILTWDVIPEQVIELARIYRLKIIMGIWVEPDGAFDDEAFVQKSIHKVRTSIEQTKDHENIIIYLISGEPNPTSVSKAGVDKTVDFYKKLVEVSHKAAPERPVSISNWIKSSWLDMSLFNISCYDLYGHDFDETRANIGMKNYISWLKSRPDVKNKPFLVTEFGYSVSPKGEGNYGYGGNTLEEQAIGNVRLYREIVQSGAIGACVFEWNDEWWKAGEPFRHNPTTEEWFGIIGIEDRNNPRGKPRPAYYALQEALKVVVVSPKDMSKITGEVLFEVNALPSITMVEYQINDGKWVQLVQEGQWWRGKWDSATAADGEKIIQIRGREADAEKSTEVQSFHIWTYNQSPVPPEPIQLKAVMDKKTYYLGDKLMLTVELTDERNKPIGEHLINIAYENPEKWDLAHWEGLTNNQGIWVQEIPLNGNQSGYYFIFVGTNYKEGNFQKQYAKILQLWLNNR